ncbi:MAG: methytransferase partner Trm112 [Thermoplasmatota archaeon]
MKRDLMDILCCPVHKSDLKLTVTKENEEEILEGDLFCAQCNFHYPISGGIPNLLPPEMHETPAKGKA